LAWPPGKLDVRLIGFGGSSIMQQLNNKKTTNNTAIKILLDKIMSPELFEKIR
jgi:hypothetical protein